MVQLEVKRHAGLAGRLDERQPIVQTLLEVNFPHKNGSPFDQTRRIGGGHL